MSTGEHEIKEYNFVEEFIVNEEIVKVLKVLAVVLPMIPLAVSVWMTLLDRNKEAVVEAMLAFMTEAILCWARSQFTKAVNSKITVFDTYIVFERDNIIYSSSDIRKQKHTMHYEDIDRVTFDNKRETLTICGVSEATEYKYRAGTRMVVTPPTMYKRDYERLEIKLAAHTYEAIVEFIMHNTPLKVTNI